MRFIELHYPGEGDPRVGPPPGDPIWINADRIVEIHNNLVILDCGQFGREVHVHELAHEILALLNT